MTAAWTKCGRSIPRCAYRRAAWARYHDILYFHFFLCVQRNYAESWARTNSTIFFSAEK